MPQPEISVIVPVFNAQAHLATLLSSLLGQSERSLEIIAVDDGSTDDSAHILRSAAAKDARLTVLTQANQGVSAARNAGLSRAKGRWIGFADSDDWLDPHALTTWREHGDRTGVDVVLGNGFRFSGASVDAVKDASAHLVRHPLPDHVFCGADWIRHCVRHADWSHFVWLQLIRRDMLVQSGLRFEEGIIHEDVAWSMQLGLRAQRIGYVPQPLYGYRIHAASLTHNPARDALYRRAQGYIIVMQQFMAAADDPRNEVGLRRALLRHAQREGRNLFTLMREGVLSSGMRRTIATEFVRHGLLRPMFQGAENMLTLLRAVRCWRLMRHCARLPAAATADT